MTFLGRDAPNLLAHLARMGRDGSRHVNRMGHLDVAHGRVGFKTGFRGKKVPNR